MIAYLLYVQDKWGTYFSMIPKCIIILYIKSMTMPMTLYFGGVLLPLEKMGRIFLDSFKGKWLNANKGRFYL